MKKRGCHFKIPRRRRRRRRHNEINRNKTETKTNDVRLQFRSVAELKWIRRRGVFRFKFIRDSSVGFFFFFSFCLFCSFVAVDDVTKADCYDTPSADWSVSQLRHPVKAQTKKKEEEERKEPTKQNRNRTGSHPTGSRRRLRRPTAPSSIKRRHPTASFHGASRCVMIH